MVHRLILMSKEGLIAKLAKSCKRRFLTLYARLRAVGDFGVPSTDQHANAETERPWRTSRNSHNMSRVEPSGSGTYRDRGGQSIDPQRPIVCPRAGAARSGRIAAPAYPSRPYIQQPERTSHVPAEASSRPTELFQLQSSFPP